MVLRTPGPATLRDLDGSVFEQEGGFWVKIVATRVVSTPSMPHGIEYSLTLHDCHGASVLGYDNAHAVKPPKKRFVGRRMEYDHRHRSASDKGVPYFFDTRQGLLEDFFAEVDRVIAAAKEVS